MSDENTQNMPDGRSFEERVFARFDSLDARLQALETQAERRAMETRPIWERALAEILELRESLANVERKIDVLSRDARTGSRRPGASGGQTSESRIRFTTVI